MRSPNFFDNQIASGISDNRNPKQCGSRDDCYDVQVAFWVIDYFLLGRMDSDMPQPAGPIRTAERSQQSSHNTDPFRVQRLSANRLSRPALPIGCVALIAFLAMQVGVNPRTLGAFVLLSRTSKDRSRVSVRANTWLTH